MTIMWNAVRERIRRKELYIVVAIAVLLFLLFGSGDGSLTINGEPVTGYESTFKILLVLANAAGCVLSMVISLKTIPKEYETRTSHLVWIRGISQSRYHGELVMANVAASIFADGILYLFLMGYTLILGTGDYFIRMIPAYLIFCINAVIVSMLVSVVSIRCPAWVTGLVGMMCVLAGIFHSVLNLYRNMVGGISGTALKWLLLIMPDLAGLQTQASNLIFGKEISVHEILKGILIIYILSIGILVIRRREA